MNRKLRNSLTALASCSIALVLALVGVSPLIHAGDPPRAATSADALAVDLASARASAPCTRRSPCPAQAGREAAIDAGGAPLIRNIKSARDAATTRSRGRPDSRQPLVMPYFSFAPRG